MGAVDDKQRAALFTLIGEDPQRMRAYVESQLGPILADRKRSRRLLKSLEAYLSNGQSVANASAACGLHRDTVSRHREEIERLLGYSIDRHSLEIHLALVLRRRLAGPPAA